MVQVSSDCLRAIKDYLADMEGYTIGEALEDAWFFAMENVDDFEDYAEIEEAEGEEDTSEEENEKEDESEE